MASPWRLAWRPRRLGGSLLCALTAVASAAPPAPPPPLPQKVVAVAASLDDARAAILVGPEGQLYAPDGHGAWLRTQGGGIGNAVLVATRGPGATVLVGADGAPPYRHDGTAWAAIYLAMHAKAVVARGQRAVAAVGRQVFALDHAEPQRLPDAPGPVTLVGASAGGVTIATDRGLARLDGKSWRAIERAPRGVLALASERWAITATGAGDLKASQTITWPAGDSVTAYAADGDTLVACAATTAGVDLITVHRGQVAREAVPLAPPGVPVGVAVDHSHRTSIALADGRVLVREHDTWTTTEVRDAWPAPRAGPGPATGD